jgi:hypothetical protein
MRQKKVEYDAGVYCPGYSCCNKARDVLMFCPTKQGYVGNKSLACDKHAISWSGLAKQREEERKKREEKKPVVV